MSSSNFNCRSAYMNELKGMTIQELDNLLKEREKEHMIESYANDYGGNLYGQIPRLIEDRNTNDENHNQSCINSNENAIMNSNELNYDYIIDSGLGCEVNNSQNISNDFSNISNYDRIKSNKLESTEAKINPSEIQETNNRVTNADNMNLPLSVSNDNTLNNNITNKSINTNDYLRNNNTYNNMNTKDINTNTSMGNVIIGNN